MSSQHIGAAGELLVQYQLLKHNIDSARLTTDSGVDLVVYAPGSREAFTVQVKAVLATRPSGGRLRGKESVAWRFRNDTPAKFVALVLLATDTVWMLETERAIATAQQLRDGVHELYFYLDETVKAGKNGVPLRQSDMAPFLLQNRTTELFPVEHSVPALG